MKAASENIASIPPVASPSAPALVIPYEQRLAASISYVLDEGGRLFMGASEVTKTLQRITTRLGELDIDYAVAGGMAMIAHGYMRFTDDVDILVTREDLDRLHQAVDGLGWVRPFSTSKNLRDANTGVKIEFLLSGDFPGDGKPKPVAFPRPSDVAMEIQGIKYLDVSTLINLKLASFMTGGVDRAKDQGDVVELMKARSLSYELLEKVHPYVRDQYRELCDRLSKLDRPHALLWQGDLANAATISNSNLIEQLVGVDPSLIPMFADGIVPVVVPSKFGLRVLLRTTDRRISRKYQMVDESEIMLD
jgi:hypothetical protein